MSTIGETSLLASPPEEHLFQAHLVSSFAHTDSLAGISGITGNKICHAMMEVFNQWCGKLGWIDSRVLTFSSLSLTLSLPPCLPPSLHFFLFTPSLPFPSLLLSSLSYFPLFSFFFFYLPFLFLSVPFHLYFEEVGSSFLLHCHFGLHICYGCDLSDLGIFNSILWPISLMLLILDP